VEATIVNIITSWIAFSSRLSDLLIYEFSNNGCLND
jgi:hypothetical protein